MNAMQLYLACLLATAHGAFLGGLRAPTRTAARSSARSFVSMDVSKGVVITGGAGGVGYAYADSFLARGHWVVICDVKDPADAVAALRAKHASVPNAKIEGCVCDVSDASSVEALGAFAKEKLGTIHYWINNAGINGGRRPFTEVPTNVVEAVVKVNLVGLLLCTHAAIQMLQQQKGVKSHIFQTVG